MRGIACLKVVSVISHEMLNKCPRNVTPEASATIMPHTKGREIPLQKMMWDDVGYRMQSGK